MFGLSDPFLKFYKLLNQDDWVLVYRTEVVKDNLNPEWKPFTIASSRLIGENQTFRVECWDWHKKGKHNQYMGKVEVPLKKCDEN